MNEELKAYASELVADGALSGTIRTDELTALLSRLERAERNADTYQTLYEQRAESLEHAERAAKRVRDLSRDYVIPESVQSLITRALDGESNE